MDDNKSSFTSLFALVVLISAGHFMIDFMLSIWPVYKTMIRLDLSQAALIAAVAVTAGEIMQLVFGKLIDKGHAKKLVIAGPLVGCAALLFPYFSSILSFFFLILFTVLGSAAFHPTAASILGTIVTPRRALLMGIFQMSGNIGLGVGQLFFTKTYEYVNGHTAVLIVPALLLALCTASLALRSQTASKEKQKISIKLIGSFFQHPVLRRLYFIQLCHQTVLWSMVFLLPDLLQSRGYSSTVALGGGHFALLFGAGLGCLPAGLLGDRFTPAKTIFGCYLVGIVTLYTILFSPALSSVALTALLFVFGASLGPMTPLSLSIGTGLIPHLSGMISAFLMGLVWIVAETIGISFSGVVADMFTTDGPAKALLLLGLYLPVGSYFAYRLKGALAPQEVIVTSLSN